MNLINFVWQTFVGIAQKDFDKVRLILDERLSYPVLSCDEVGYVVMLPLPKRLRGHLYTLHGEYYDANENSWSILWRNFKASIYHAALHVAYSDFNLYKAWAKAKDIKTAIFCVSLVEDLYATFKGVKNHPGILYDIAYSNYTSALRLNSSTFISNASLRYATLLLLSAWGLERVAGPLAQSEGDVVRITQKIKTLVFEAIRGKDTSKLIEGAQLAYSSITRRGLLTEIPSLPYTDAHSERSVFSSTILAESDDLLRSSYSCLGLEVDHTSLDDLNESFSMFESAESKLDKMKEHYRKIVSATRFEDLQIPIEDYSLFLRLRADLAGTIASIKNQLKLVKTEEDEVFGDESGQLDVQTAIQVIASRSVRNDVFTRDEKIHKLEAWAILLDASKSIKTAAPEVKKVAVCLAEVAKDLIPAHNLWGLFAFNKSFIILKDFNEPYSMDTKARIGGLSQSDSTFLPDAMLACSKALSLLPAEPKILMVVSDGYPVGYRNIEKELVRKVHKIAKSGILMFGIGIKNQAIRGYFTANCILREPYEMMKFFIRSYYELSSLF